jgi:hypothetical protein
VIVAALLGAIALQAVTSPAPSPSPFAGGAPVVSARRCGPTLLAAVDPTSAVTRRDLSFSSSTYRGYAFAMWASRNSLALSGWFKRRAGQWCLVGTAGDWIELPDAVRFGVPERVAKRLVKLYEAAQEVEAKK